MTKLAVIVVVVLAATQLKVVESAQRYAEELNNFRDSRIEAAETMYLRGGK